MIEGINLPTDIAILYAIATRNKEYTVVYCIVETRRKHKYKPGFIRYINGGISIGFPCYCEHDTYKKAMKSLQEMLGGAIRSGYKIMGSTSALTFCDGI